MSPSPLPLINLHYIFCVVYSWFGGRCITLGSEALDAARAAEEAAKAAADGVVSAANLVPKVEASWLDWVNPQYYGAHDTAGAGGFWSWLNPFSSSAASTAGTSSDAAATAGQSLWSVAYQLMPGFVQSVIDTVGWLLYYVWLAFSYSSLLVAGLAFSFILTALVIIMMLRARTWDTRAYQGSIYPSTRPLRIEWEAILAHALEREPRAWRESLIAADDLIARILREQGYAGATNNDVLRSVPEGAFISLTTLWEAHRVTNFVRARSPDFVLTSREAYRVLKLYEQYLEEFRLI